MPGTRQPTDLKVKSAEATPTKKTPGTFSDEELAAMKERSEESRGGKKVIGESAVLAKIAEMNEPDRSMAKRLHALIKASVPGLTPRTWYGMPAYTSKDGKVICYFQSGQKYKVRYSTFGFQDAASLDEGNMWPIAFALTKLTAVEEAKIGALLKTAMR